MNHNLLSLPHTISTVNTVKRTQHPRESRPPHVRRRQTEPHHDPLIPLLTTQTKKNTYIAPTHHTTPHLGKYTYSFITYQNVAPVSPNARTHPYDRRPTITRTAHTYSFFNHLPKRKRSPDAPLRRALPHPPNGSLSVLDFVAAGKPGIALSFK